MAGTCSPTPEVYVRRASGPRVARPLSRRACIEILVGLLAVLILAPFFAGVLGEYHGTRVALADMTRERDALKDVLAQQAASGNGGIKLADIDHLGPGTIEFRPARKGRK